MASSECEWAWVREDLRIDEEGAMQPATKVIRPNEEQTHDRGSGVRTTYLVTRERGATAFSSGLTEFEPGSALPCHSQVGSSADTA